MSKCKYCGAPIRWVKTINGKTMPCDDKKYSLYKGDKYTMVTVTGRTVKCDLEGTDKTFIGFGYVPHWSTCPGAKQAKADKRAKQ